jgi:syntaxin-binding protein 1
LVSRIKTFKELNLDFLAIEAQSFTLDRKERGFWNLYSSSSQDGQAELRVITNQLATVMTTLKEFPYIRFARERPMCQQVARQVGESLAVLRAKVPDYANGCREQRATLIIVDRSFDALAPVLHDFYYQAMTMDLLEVKNGEQFNYSYVNNAGVTEKKDVLLNEHDKIWPQVRHMHIAECIDFVIDSFNEFLKNNKAAGLSTGKVNDLKGMSEAVRAMPQYKELLAKYSLHIYISQELMKLFNTHGLEAIAGCEQNMAMGEDASGTKIKNVINMITPLLSNASVDLQNKLRLIMIYIITQEGIKTSDRQTLMKVAKIEPAMEATIANLTNLGVRLTKGAKDGKKKSKAKATRRDSDVPFELSRYEPFAKALLYDLTEGTLPAEAFPYSGEQPSGAGPSAAPTAGGTAGKSMRTGAGPKHKWADNRKGAAKEELAVQPRVILFVIGGMTYSEMRVAYEVAAATNHDIFIGSTDTITPSSFLKWVGDLSNADPNSLA